MSNVVIGTKKKGSVKKNKPALFNHVEVAKKLHVDILRELNCDRNSIDLNDVSKTDPYQIFAFQQSSKFLGKFDEFEPKTADSLEQLAFQKFLGVNSHIDSINISLEAVIADLVTYDRETTRTSKGFKRFLLLLKNYVHAMLPPFTAEELFAACKHSSGTSLGLTYSNTSLKEKFRLPMTITEELIPLAKLYLKWDPQFLEALLDVNPEYRNKHIDTFFLVVNGSRSTTVAKNTESRRMIAVEPTWNMFFQQGFMILFVDILRTFGLDLEKLQDQHRYEAFIQSILRKKSTIDWASASDCVASVLVRFCFPPAWYSGLDLVRCKTSEIKIGKEKQEVSLHMFSTMGNATTFPLECILFYAIAKTTIHIESGIKTMIPDFTQDDVSIFGDDCIVPTESTESFIANATMCGFLCNKEKSYFGDSWFRESCGGDFYCGRNVRPFQLKAPHNLRRSSLEPWLYIIMNNLLKKWKNCFGDIQYVYRSSFMATCLELFVSNNFSLKLVPNFYPDDSGLHIDDWERLNENWVKPSRVKLSPIYVSEHGSVKFNFCRFQYKYKEEANDGPSFWQTIRNLEHKSSEIDDVLPSYVDKRIGGYVVGKGLMHYDYVVQSENKTNRDLPEIPADLRSKAIIRLIKKYLS